MEARPAGHLALGAPDTSHAGQLRLCTLSLPVHPPSTSSPELSTRSLALEAPDASHPSSCGRKVGDTALLRVGRLVRLLLIWHITCRQYTGTHGGAKST